MCIRDRIQVQRLAVGGLGLARVAARVLQQAQQVQRFGAGAMLGEVDAALGHGFLHPALVGQHGDCLLYTSRCV